MDKKYSLLLRLFIVPVVFLTIITAVPALPALAASETEYTTQSTENEVIDRRNQTTNSSSSSPLIIALIVLGALGGISIIGGIVIHFYNREHERDILFHDRKRKHDIERIRYSLSAFAKTYGRYPNVEKSEYLELLKQLDPFPIDPLADKETGFNYQKYNYYYDNQSLETRDKGRNNPKYYRIWCHLENNNDPEINSLYSKAYKNIYLRTSADALNPLLLEVPVKEEPKKRKPLEVHYQPVPVTSMPVAYANETIEPQTIEEHRKESMVRFLLIITGLILVLSAIINGMLYWMIRSK